MCCIGFACCRSYCALLRIADLWMVWLGSPTMRSRCCAKPTTSSLPSSWASMNTRQGLTSSSPRSACHVFKCLYTILFLYYVGTLSINVPMGDGAEAQDLMHHQLWQCPQLWPPHKCIYSLASRHSNPGQQAKGGACKHGCCPCSTAHLTQPKSIKVMSQSCYLSVSTATYCQTCQYTATYYMLVYGHSHVTAQRLTTLSWCGSVR